MQQGNYASARDAANRVIATGQFRLAATYPGAFNSRLTNGGANPAEYVFAIQVNDQDGNNGMNTFFGATISGIPGTAGRGEIRIQPGFINLYGAEDTRRQFFTRVGPNTLTNKFLDRFGNVPVVRLADVNLIRARAGATPLAAVMLADILKERRLELAFEGFALHDIKRTQGAVGALHFSSPKLVLPVPQRVMDINKKLVQNEGY